MRRCGPRPMQSSSEPRTSGSTIPIWLSRPKSARAGVGESSIRCFQRLKNVAREEVLQKLHLMCRKPSLLRELKIFDSTICLTFLFSKFVSKIVESHRPPLSAGATIGDRIQPNSRRKESGCPLSCSFDRGQRFNRYASLSKTSKTVSSFVTCRMSLAIFERFSNFTSP